MSKVAVATTSQLAADAADAIATSGGNAVDCGLAAALVSINTEPGVCALAGGAYVTIWPPEADPITIDGNVAMPGRGRSAGTSLATRLLRMDYGNGIETMIGAASIAVPGALAAIETAWRQHGSLPWREILAPSIRATSAGFPLSAASHHYLQYSGTVVFGNSDDGFAALHDESGALRPPRSLIRIPHLADSLAAIAEEGARVFYEGEIASRIAAHVAERDGLLTTDDLRDYRAVTRASMKVNLRQWQIASNPPPAIGGTMLSAMLQSFASDPIVSWDRESLRRLVQMQHAILSYRKDRLDLSDDIESDTARLLSLCDEGKMLSRWSSASTVHTSAVDDSGLACAVTASSGYGSGEMPAGTGLWLNNCIGELELNRKGFDAGPPGTRLPSNMSPSVARCGSRVLAIGSPGADRITTALHQFLVNFIQLEFSLGDAVAHPRLHLHVAEDGCRIAAEPGLDVPVDVFPVYVYPRLSMYFGGVAAALCDGANGFEVAADPRREGGTCIAGT
jgi:gamma-glutamyltranspeptidase/glutathione hydrolase